MGANDGGDVPVKFTLTADEQAVLRSIDATSKGLKQIAFDAKDAARAISDAERNAQQFQRTINFHGSMSRAQIGNQFVGNLSQSNADAMILAAEQRSRLASRQLGVGSEVYRLRERLESDPAYRERMAAMIAAREDRLRDEPRGMGRERAAVTNWMRANRLGDDRDDELTRLAATAVRAKMNAVNEAITQSLHEVGGNVAGLKLAAAQGIDTSNPAAVRQFVAQRAAAQNAAVLANEANSYAHENSEVQQRYKADLRQAIELRDRHMRRRSGDRTAATRIDRGYDEAAVAERARSDASEVSMAGAGGRGLLEPSEENVGAMADAIERQEAPRRRWRMTAWRRMRSRMGFRAEQIDRDYSTEGLTGEALGPAGDGGHFRRSRNALDAGADDVSRMEEEERLSAAASARKARDAELARSAERADRRNNLISSGINLLGAAGTAIYAGNNLANTVAEDQLGYSGAAGDFEREMRPFLTLDQNASRQQELRRRVLSMAISMGTTTGDAASTLYNFYGDSSQFDPKTQREMLRSGVTLSRLSDATPTENLRAIMRVQSTYGAAAGGPDTIAARLMRTTELGSITAQNLASRLPDVLPAFQGAGFSLNDALGAVAVGSTLTGRPETLSTDLRTIAVRMSGAYAAGLATRGKSFADNIGELASHNLTVPQLTQTFGLDALTTVQSLIQHRTDLASATTDIAGTSPDLLRQKGTAYEADPATALGLRSQRLQATADALKKGMVTFGPGRERAAEGADDQAVNIGWDYTMDSLSKGLATPTSGLDKILYRQMFKGAGYDLTAQGSFEQFASGRGGGEGSHDRGDYDRGVADRVAGGAFIIADSKLSTTAGAWMDSNGVTHHSWGLPLAPGITLPTSHPAGYRQTNQSDVDAWQALRKSQGWDVPFSVFQTYTNQVETGTGNPAAFLANERRRLGPKPVQPFIDLEKTSAMGVRGTPELTPAEILEAGGGQWNRPSVTRDQLNAVRESREDKDNRAFIRNALRGLSDRAKAFKGQGAVFAAGEQMSVWHTIKDRYDDLAHDSDGMTPLDRRTLRHEIETGTVGQRTPSGAETTLDSLAKVLASLDKTLQGFQNGQNGGGTGKGGSPSVAGPGSSPSPVPSPMLNAKPPSGGGLHAP